METKFEIIETPEYYLAVSDEGIKRGDYFWKPDMNMVFKAEYTPYKGCKKIIAYQPKNNVPELGLPLLPEMVVGDEVERLAENYINMLIKEGWDLLIPQHTESFIQGMKMGIKSTTKIYSEEDLRKAIDMCIDLMRDKYTEFRTHKETIIQSLKQPKTPTWFVAEYNERCKCGINCEFEVCKHESKLKTTTINGKTYLVGKYLN
jgi:hypothetical protein